MTDKPVIPLAEQIKEVGRELGLRRNVYRTFVARQSMTQAEADDHIAKMEAAYATLKWLQANETKIKEAVKSDG